MSGNAWRAEWHSTSAVLSLAVVGSPEPWRVATSTCSPSRSPAALRPSRRPESAGWSGPPWITTPTRFVVGVGADGMRHCRGSTNTHNEIPPSHPITSPEDVDGPASSPVAFRSRRHDTAERLIFSPPSPSEFRGSGSRRSNALRWRRLRGQPPDLQRLSTSIASILLHFRSLSVLEQILVSARH